MIRPHVVREMALHWIDGELARLKMLRQELAGTKMSSKRAAATRKKILTERRKRGLPIKLHWTQLPENKARVLAMARKGARTRNAKKVA